MRVTVENLTQRHKAHKGTKNTKKEIRTLINF